MTVRHRAAASLLAGALLALVACSAPSETATNDDDLINGKVADSGQLPSTMQILGNCTVAKVGPRHVLTAAHCVLDAAKRDVRPEFQPGRQVNVRARVGTELRLVTIERTEIVPRARDACQRGGACLGTVDIAALDDVPDAAILVVDGDIADIPTASIDVEPVKDGDALTIVGYGCLTGVRKYDPDGKLRTSDVTALATRAIVHAGSYVAGGDEALLAQVGGNYLVTPGPKLDGSAGGLCPGDSGGPVYRRGTNVIVGVNASYSFEPGGDIPVTNWHTRLDATSRYGVAAWLESLGVSLSRSCADAQCKPSVTNIDPCGGLDYRGKCTGSIIEWCQNGTYQKVDCATKQDGRTACGEDAANPANGLNCIVPTDPCHGIPFRGSCTGTVLEWCDRGAYKRVDCASKTDGRTACGEDPSPNIGLNCVSP